MLLLGGVLALGGCGDDSQNVYTLPDGRELTVSEMIDEIAKASPSSIPTICRQIEARGEESARAYFERGYESAFPDQPVPADEAFDEIASRC
jgi:hypothetical protein